MKTKNIIAILAALPVVAFFTACSSDEEKEAKPAKETLMVVGGSIQQYAADEQRAEFMVQADCRWTINEADIEYGDFSRDELIISPHQGNGNGTITITSMKNTDTKAREATFVIVSDGGLKQKITIQQNKAADNLIVSVEALEYLAKPTAAENLTKFFSVYSNVGASISGCPNWLTLYVKVDESKGDEDDNWTILSEALKAGTHSIKAVCVEAMDDAGRSGQLTVSSTGQQPQYITVKQEGMDINDIFLEIENIHQGHELSFGSTGGENGLWIRSNAEWHVTVSDGSWLEVSTTEGRGEGEVRVFCEGNPNSNYERLATIIVYAGTKTPVQREVRVRQGHAEYPTLGEITLDGSSITTSSAQVAFNVVNPGFGISSYGICYSHDNHVPTIEDERVEGYSATISGLEQKTTYYVRGYVVSSAIPQIVVYTSNVVAFTTQSSIVIPGNNDNPNPNPAPRFQ